MWNFYPLPLWELCPSGYAYDVTPFEMMLPHWWLLPSSKILEPPLLSCLVKVNHQLLHFYLAVIRPILEYAAPVWHHLLSKCQEWSHWGNAEKSSQYHLYLHLWHALFKYSVSCWTHQSHISQRKTVTYFFSLYWTTHFMFTLPTSNPTRSWTSHSFESTIKISRIPNRTKKYQSFISYALSKYQTS